MIKPMTRLAALPATVAGFLAACGFNCPDTEFTRFEPTPQALEYLASGDVQVLWSDIDNGKGGARGRLSDISPDSGEILRELYLDIAATDLAIGTRTSMVLGHAAFLPRAADAVPRVGYPAAPLLVQRIDQGDGLAAPAQIADAALYGSLTFDGSIYRAVWLEESSAGKVAKARSVTEDGELGPVIDVQVGPEGLGDPVSPWNGFVRLESFAGGPGQTIVLIEDYDCPDSFSCNGLAYVSVVTDAGASDEPATKVLGSPLGSTAILPGPGEAKQLLALGAGPCSNCGGSAYVFDPNDLTLPAKYILFSSGVEVFGEGLGSLALVAGSDPEEGVLLWPDLSMTSFELSPSVDTGIISATQWRGSEAGWVRAAESFSVNSSSDDGEISVHLEVYSSQGAPIEKHVISQQHGTYQPEIRCGP